MVRPAPVVLGLLPVSVYFAAYTRNSSDYNVLAETYQPAQLGLQKVEPRSVWLERHAQGGPETAFRKKYARREHGITMHTPACKSRHTPRMGRSKAAPGYIVSVRAG